MTITQKKNKQVDLDKEAIHSTHIVLFKDLSFFSALKNGPSLSQLKDIHVTTIQPAECIWHLLVYVCTVLHIQYRTKCSRSVPRY